MGQAQRAGAFITLSTPLTLLYHARASANLSANMSHIQHLVCISGGKFVMMCNFVYWKISLVRMRCCKGGVLDSLERKLYFFDLYIIANISFLLVSYDHDM